MGIHSGPRVVLDSLVYYLDLANTDSYSGSGTAVSTLYDRDQVSADSTINGTTYTYSAGSHISFAAADYITLSSLALPPLDNRCSISMWVRRPTDPTAGEVLFATKEDRDRLIYFQSDDGLFRGTCYNGSTPGTEYVTSTSQITDFTNEWINITFTNDLNDGSNHVMKMYINGVLEGTNTASTSTEGGADTSANYWLRDASAISAGQPNNNFAGDASILMLYEKVLTADEVKQNFEALRKRHGR